MVDLDRITKREAYDAGLAEGRAQAAADGPRWTRPTFALAVAVTLFAMWVCGYVLIHASEVTLELAVALIGTVSAIPIAYAWPRKPGGQS